MGRRRESGHLGACRRLERTREREIGRGRGPENVGGEEKRDAAKACGAFRKCERKKRATDVWRRGARARIRGAIEPESVWR